MKYALSGSWVYGLEALLEREIRNLKIVGSDPATSYDGGVSFEGSDESLCLGLTSVLAGGG